MPHSFNLVCLLLAVAATLVMPSMAAGAVPGRNLVAGLPAQYDPAPTYADTADEGDIHQLTDGLYGKPLPADVSDVGAGAIWSQRTATVGWQYVSPLSITFDLGSSQRIGCVSVSTAAGSAGVYWPRAIALMVSDDKKDWRFAGELVSLSRGDGLPKVQEYSQHRFVARDLHISGRYVAFVVSLSGTPFFFSDEIEVYADTNLKAPLQKGVAVGDFAAAQKFVMDNATCFGVETRMARDYAAIREELQLANLLPARKKELGQQLEKAAAQIGEVPVAAANKFKAILPLNAPHSEMMKVHGAVLASRGLSPLFIWKNHRFDYVEWLDKPPVVKTAGELNISVLGNERRGDAFWIGNASQRDQQVTLTVAGPRGAKRGWLRLYQVPWVDTAQGAPMPCALVPLQVQGGKYTLTLPAGMTSKLWCEVEGGALPAGSHRTVINLKSGSNALRISLAINSIPSPVASFAGDDLGLGLWDYTDHQGAYAINPKNLKAAIALARDYGVDMPSAGPAVLPPPQATDFDANDQLIKALDFRVLDEWVARWPNARAYTVFINQQAGTFAGAAMGTPAFEARLGAWGRAILAHLKTLKLRPEQLPILILDEPRTAEQDAILAGWIKAFKKGAPELVIFSDPIWPDPSQSPHQEAFTLPDILCPNMQVFLRDKKISEEYYLARQAAGQPLWFYECSAAARLSDPTSYFRLQAWWAFRYGATSVHYWALGDTGGAINSWNEYTGGRGLAYTPAFIGEDSAIGSVQFEAIREGVQDYRAFTILRQRAESSRNEALKQEAARLLSPASLETVCNFREDYSWRTARDHAAADRFRAQVLGLIEKIEKD